MHTSTLPPAAADLPQPTADLATLIASTLRFADAHYARKDWLAARDFLSLAAQINPNYPRLLGSLGSLQFQLQEYPTACSTFSAAVRRNPDDPDLQIQLAMVHLKLEHLEAVEAALNRALGLRPDDPTALKLLADMNRDHGGYRDAALIYGKLINHHLDQAGVLLSLAKCFFELGDREGAQAALEHVLAVDPNNEIAHDNLGVIGTQAGASSPAPLLLGTDTRSRLSSSSLRLDFGCGEVGPRSGFVGVDIRSFPGVQYTCNAWEIVDHVKPSAVEAICSRHFFEHLTFKQAEVTLKAWMTVLQPGGILEAIVPDIRYHIDQFLAADPNHLSETNSKWTVRQHAVAGFWGWQREAETSLWDVHKSGYDYPLLHDVLQRAGFQEIQRLPEQPCNLAVKCRKSGAEYSFSQSRCKDLLIQESSDCKAAVHSVSPETSCGATDSSNQDANETSSTQHETAKPPIYLPEPVHPRRDAAYYQRLHEQESGYQTNNWLLDEIDQIVSFGASTVLELACGNGRFLERAASLFECVMGCDWAVSPRMKGVLVAHSNVKFFQVDLYQQLPSCRAELVVSADFLEHIDPHSLLGVLQRIDLLADMAFHKVACYDDNHSHLSVFPPAEWLALFQRVNPAYELERTELRRADPVRQIAVFSKGRPYATGVQHAEVQECGERPSRPC